METYPLLFVLIGIPVIIAGLYLHSYVRPTLQNWKSRMRVNNTYLTNDLVEAFVEEEA
jgi:hypothetical protein